MSEKAPKNAVRGPSDDLRFTETTEIRLEDAVTRGIRLCRAERWEDGLELLSKAARKKKHKEKLPSLYYSYMGYGAARFEGSPQEGRRLCRHAIRLDPGQPENYLNLARVCLLTGDRRGAIVALKRGQRVRPNHGGLRAFAEEIGYRGRPVIPFLSRDNPLNRWLGARRRREERRTS